MCYFANIMCKMCIEKLLPNLKVIHRQDMVRIQVELCCYVIIGGTIRVHDLNKIGMFLFDIIRKWWLTRSHICTRFGSQRLHVTNRVSF